MKDQKGFMWIGTEDGLNKYDSYTFTIYRNNPSDSTSISDNIVQCLVEDGDYIWVGTRGGLNRYNKITNKFKRYFTSNKNRTSINDNLISCLFKDRSGRVWIGTDNGFNLYNPVQDNFSSFLFHANLIDKVSHNWVKGIIEGSDGMLWISSISGLYHFNPDKKQFINSYEDSLLSESLETNIIDYVIEDKLHNLWIGTYEKGLFMKEKETRKLFHFVYDPTNHNSLCGNQVDHIMQDYEGNIWISTNHGLSILYNNTKLNRNNGVFRNFHQVINNENGLSTNSISTTYQDNEKNIWIGGRFGNLDIITKPFRNFINYKFTEMGDQFISNNMTSIAEDKNNNLWFGTDGGGIYFWNRKNNTYKVYRNKFNDKSTISSDKVLALCVDSYNTLWVGSWDGGIDRLDINNHSIVHYRMNSNNNCSPVSDHVFNIMEDKSKNIWIGFWGAGINMFDRKSNCFKKFHYGTYDSNSISGYNVIDILEDKKGYIWIGTETDGLSVLERENLKFKHFNLSTANKNSKINIGVNTIYEDSKERLWVGSRLGLDLFDRKSLTSKNISTKDGLPNDFICGIIEDKHGNLWVSTNNGISKIIVNEKDGKLDLKFKNYDKSDGLLNNQFNKWSYLKTTSGEFIFGGLGGITMYYPDSLYENRIVPNIVITGFSIFNKPMTVGAPGSPLKMQISETKKITLTYDQSVISLEYAALSFTGPGKNEYAYKLEGFDKDWNKVGTQRKATFTNLNPGKYTFRVKGCNIDGYWNDEGTSINLIILPPWWLTWWFKLFSIGLIIALVLLFFNIKIALYKRIQKELTQKIEDRTSELLKTNDLLLDRQKRIEDYAKKIKSHNKTLKEANIQLSNQQILIAEQSDKMRINSENLEKANKLLLKRKNVIQLQAEKLEETNQELTLLNATKDKFFSIIGHDLRNPFNVVMGFSELLISDYTKLSDEKINKYLHIILGASKNGYNLLENLLQWSHSQTGHISFEPKEINLAQVSGESIDLLRADSHRKNIHIKLSIDNDIMVYVDENMLRTVFRNLVSNAIKFTRTGGNISIFSKINKDFAEISIADNGIGISQESIKKLFDIETTITTKGTSEESGTGLGLVLCKEFIEKHNGKIWVESELGNGSIFKFTIPLHNNFELQ